MADQPVIISIDPGSVHNGVSEWWMSGDKWVCTSSVEMTPEDCVDYVRGMLEVGVNVRVIVEGFWLRPGVAAMQQAGSDFVIVEVIGTIKNLCRWAGVECILISPGTTKATHKRLEGAGYQYTSRGHGGHAKDSEAVGVAGLRLSVHDLEGVAKRPGV